MHIFLIGIAIALAPIVLFLVGGTLFLVFWIVLVSYYDERNLETAVYGASLFWIGLFILLPYYALVDHSKHMKAVAWDEPIR